LGDFYRCSTKPSAPLSLLKAEEVEARDLKVRPDHCLVWPMDIRT